MVLMDPFETKLTPMFRRIPMCVLRSYFKENLMDTLVKMREEAPALESIVGLEWHLFFPSRLSAVLVYLSVQA